MSFGAGQRQCIGKDFSIMEAQIILAMIVQRYTMQAVPGPAVRPKFSTTLKPDRPVLVNLERRASSYRPGVILLLLHMTIIDKGVISRAAALPITPLQRLIAPY